MSQHSLEKPSFVTAGILFGAWGGGLAVTQALPPLFWLGIIICFGSALFTVWRYYGEVLASLAGKAAALPKWEGCAVSLLVVVEIAGTLYLAAPKVISVPHQNSHTATVAPISAPIITRQIIQPPPSPVTKPIAKRAVAQTAAASKHLPSAPSIPLVAAPAVPQEAQTFMEDLRKLWVNSNDNVPASIVAEKAWPPEDWLNRMLGTYDRDWRVKTNGPDYILESQPFATPPDSGPIYNHGTEVLALSDAQRALFTRALMPPSFQQTVTIYIAHTPYAEEDKYQQQIATLIPADSGWNAKITSGPDIDKLAEAHSGIVVFVDNPESISVDEHKIITALMAAHLAPTPVKNIDTKGGWVGILVGRDKKYELIRALQDGKI